MTNLDNKGIALVMVLLMIIVVGGLSGTLLIAYNSNINQSSNQAVQTKAFYAAEGGINYLDARIYELNTQENDLPSFYLGKGPFQKRYETVVEEIEELNNSLVISDFNISYKVPENHKKENSFVVEVIADNSNFSEKIEVTYKLASKGLAFFAHTLAARTIEMNGNLVLRGNYPEEGSYPLIATSENSKNADINKSNVDLQELRGWWIFKDWESLTGYQYDQAYNNTFQFYGDGDDELYLPEDNDANDFKEYVRSINFREVLKQNGITDYIIGEDEEGNPITVSLDQFEIPTENEEILYNITDINPEMDSNKLDLSSFQGRFPDSLNGFYEDFDDLQTFSNSNTGPYIYIENFDFSPNRNINYEIDFTNINSVKNNENESGVVQLYIDDNIDFSNTSKNIYFSSRDEKSVLIQSGGSKINLDNNRILYYSSGVEGQIKSIAYYAPNAEMRISGNMPGTGWGQSYNVKKIIVEDDVTFPPMVYDPEKSGLYGNIHPDIGGYFEEDQEELYSNKAPGEVFKVNWKTIK